jgi:hypothetical protein
MTLCREKAGCIPKFCDWRRWMADVIKEAMKPILANPESAAAVSLMLCLSITIIFLLLWQNIEPPIGRLPVAPVMDLMPVVREVHAGSKVTMHPIHLVLAMVI